MEGIINWIQNLFENFQFEQFVQIVTLVFGSGASLFAVKIYNTYKKFKEKTPKEIAEEMMEQVTIKIEPLIEKATKDIIKPLLENMEIQTKNIKATAEALLLSKINNSEGLKALYSKINEIKDIDLNAIKQIENAIENQIKSEVMAQTEKEQIINELEKSIEEQEHKGL